jgi:hypothetical protein
LIEELVQETEDICTSMEWRYKIFTKEREPAAANNNEPVKYLPEHVEGISFSPPECEPVMLTFLPDGNMVSWVKLIYYNHLTNDLAIEWIHTKTQFAGPQVHIAVIKLLRYLSNKYLSFFELNDEGMYWETNDEKQLLEQFKKYNFILDAVTDALSNMKVIPGEKPQSLIDRIEEVLKKRFNGEG